MVTIETIEVIDEDLDNQSIKQEKLLYSALFSILRLTTYKKSA